MIRLSTKMTEFSCLGGFIVPTFEESEEYICSGCFIYSALSPKIFRSQGIELWISVLVFYVNAEKCNTNFIISHQKIFPNRNEAKNNFFFSSINDSNSTLKNGSYQPKIFNLRLFRLFNKPF